MKRFIIITNKPKDPGLKTTEFIRSYLEEKGAACSVYADEISTKEWREILRTEGRLASAILILGGDGTMLRAARDTAEGKIPVLGVNLGTVGYLAEVEVNGITEALDRLLLEEYSIEERMMLEGQIIRKGEILAETCSLNDVVITKGSRMRPIYFQIFVNGKFLKEYHADGIIVATPTGSTGYNLSAGGPIVEPGARLILLTPICPHTLQTRSIVLGAEDEVIIRIGDPKDEEKRSVEACFDGSRSYELEALDEVRIVRSEKTTSIIRLSEASFLDVLHRKMSE